MFPPDASPAAGFLELAARRHDGAGVVELAEAVAVETPVALVYNGATFAVMLATPLDLEDFVRGFSLTEGIVERISDISAIEIERGERGVEARATIPEAEALALRARQRALAGRSGCGVCGVDSIAQALRPVPRVESATTFSPVALRKAVAGLASGQPINARVGGVHAAAFADPNGEIVCVREDIGRHNALDKLIGALLVNREAPPEGFILVSSRCSYEMAHKTAAAGVGLIAAVSAPTSLAIETAERLRVGLVGFAREGRFTAYASPWRVASSAS